MNVLILTDVYYPFSNANSGVQNPNPKAPLTYSQRVAAATAATFFFFLELFIYCGNLSKQNTQISCLPKIHLQCKQKIATRESTPHIHIKNIAYAAEKNTIETKLKTNQKQNFKLINILN